ncbi:MAG: 3-deoxy-manno-octulosonate cytidylyltransferase [Candidatus Latescibacterota bacterium]|jgi:3-deoxy-manno-octulosonate cytidylyltransferase (CMP-KDO synthetase)
MGRNPFLVVLPARYGSTRFPGKPLAEISGRPLIEWVYRRASGIVGAGEVLVATDDRRIAEVVESFGGNVRMTGSDHATGTDRVAEVAAKSEFPIVVNLQGDEPVFDPSAVTSMVDALASDPAADIATACHPVESPEEFNNPNIVKVVFDGSGRALYFSRSPIPSGAGASGPAKAYRHVGIYAYRKESLLRFTSLERSALEKSEKLEQLRALENGMTIRVVVTGQPTFGVDVPEDVKKVEKELSRIYTGRDS